MVENESKYGGDMVRSTMEQWEKDELKRIQNEKPSETKQNKADEFMQRIERDKSERRVIRGLNREGLTQDQYREIEKRGPAWVTDDSGRRRSTRIQKSKPKYVF